MTPQTFRDLEHQGWTARAATYRDAVGRITEHAIDAILDSFGDLAGRRLLDVACGTGELAGEAARRGARVAAVEFLRCDARSGGSRSAAGRVPGSRRGGALECRDVSTAAGFSEPTSCVIELSCRLAQPHDVLDMIRRGAVRTSMVLDAQSEAARQAIEHDIVTGAEAYRNEGGVELRMPTVVTSAQAV